MNAGLLYPALPFIAWVVSGTLKYAVNRIRYGDEARNLVGNGGFPSTHTSVVSSVAMLIGFNQGFGTPMFGLAVALSYIVMIDAVGIRRAVGESAKRINALARVTAGGEAAAAREQRPLRERQGHTRVEVLGGLAVGTLLGWLGSLVLG
ncbi:divergent PAP2 family protein [Paenibacillus filicis]|uniref:Divergent PAP2 family protein n=1 Tax=Paenibacillus gyeongsangnamensis TaxID=3388067 RepID=A0ABT4QAA5_9BACL|nr:divergent PAP2 family protein [Paenibacillus filicis]MCZ8513825.1 divergent PAP2 family protein [Paenibacillus filicis]